MHPSSLRGGAGRGDDAIALCDFDDDTGSASFVDAYFNGVAGLAFVSDLALSANGAHLYTAGTSDSAIGVFSRDPGNGQLAFVKAERNGMGGVSGLDGSLAFSGSWIDNVDGIDGLDSPADVRFSRDGRSLCVASILDDAVAVFSRDEATGGVGFVQVERNGVLGIGGLGAADAVRTSPNDHYVFVTAADDDALAILAPEPSSNMLGVIALAAVYLRGRTQPPQGRPARSPRAPAASPADRGP